MTSSPDLPDPAAPDTTTSPQPEERGLPEKPDLFICYSRRDTQRVEPLLDALRAAGKELWFDLEDIPASAEWRDRVDQGIAGSDAFTFMLSDHSLRSAQCRRELDKALEYGKRLIVVKLDEPGEPIPEEIERINWIVADPDDPAPASGSLQEAADRDLDWIDFHTRLLERALEWAGLERDGSLLLRGSDLHGARDALTAADPDSEPTVTQLQTEYVGAGTSAEKRRRIVWSGIAMAVTLIAIAAGLAVWQWQVAEANERIAESLRRASDASTLYDDQLDLGLLLALEGVALDDSLQTQSELIRGVTDGPGLRSATPLSVDAPVDAAAFTPDGRWALYRTTEDVVYDWEAGSGTATDPVGSGSTTALAVSGDGTRMAFGTTDGVRILERAGGSIVAECSFGGIATVVALDAGGARVAAVIQSGGEVMVKTATADCVETGAVSPGMQINALAFQGDADMLAIGSIDGGLTLLQPSTGLPFPPPPPAPSGLRSFAFSPDGELLAGGTDNGSVHMWTVRRVDEPRRLVGGHGDWVTSVAFNEPGSRLISGSLDGTVRTWDVASGFELAVVASLPEDRAVTSVLAVVFADDDRGRSILSDGRLVTWELEDRSPLASRPSVQAGVRSVAFSVSQLAVGGAVGLELVDPGGAGLGTDPVWAGAVAAVAPLGEAGDLAFGTGDGRLVVRKPDGSFVEVGIHPGVTSVAGSRDGTLVASGGRDGRVVLTEVESGLQTAFDHGGGYVAEVAFGSADTVVISVGEDRTARVWSVAGADEVLVFRGHRATVDAVAVHPTEPVVATGSDDRTIQLWDLASGELVQRLIGHDDRVISVAFSADGARLASSSEDSTVIVWDLATGTIVGRPLRNEFGSQPQSVTFDPSDSGVVYAGGSGVHRWELRPDQVAAAACDIVGDRRFTETEAGRYLGDGDPAYACDQPS